MSKRSNPLIAIVGPTAVGKSSLAIKLAQSFHGEIVNGDSRLVYKYMDIGTDKPTIQNRNSIPHHLIDIVEPDYTYNLSTYLNDASKITDTLSHECKIPFLVGGTGQYIWGLVHGFRSPNVAPNKHLRINLEQKAAEEGSFKLWEDLKFVDEVAASRIDYRNVRRVIRALEVYMETGIPISESQGSDRNLYRSLTIGLTMDRTTLYQNIDDRIDRMIARGWVEEVRNLLDKGYNENLSSMHSIGYRDIARYINGQLTLGEAVTKIKVDTHKLARSQYSWFKPSDNNIIWFDISNEKSYTMILESAKGHISKHVNDSAII
jgi:tRNA dimethylallyltransferase